MLCNYVTIYGYLIVCNLFYPIIRSLSSADFPVILIFMEKTDKKEASDRPFTGKTALITGASRGIGRAIAGALAAAGCNLRLVCRDRMELLEPYAIELAGRYEVLVRAERLDVGDTAGVSAYFSNAGTIHYLINNAGISRMGLLTDTREEDWTALVETNLSGVYRLCREAIPGLIANNGRILNISSVWGRVGAACEVAYSATKGGVDALTRALARELAPSGIPVNSIACGAIDTDMNREHLSDEELSALAQEIPAGRLGTPEEVAQLSVLLLQAPEYMTGQIITLDGGWT